MKKPHFEDLTLENYRGFKHYRFTGFKAVNLLVGPNNCGKTSALEGIWLLANGGAPSVLANIASHRGEFGEWRSDDRRVRTYKPSVADFFKRDGWLYGRVFAISSGSPAMKVTVGLDDLPPISQGMPPPKPNHGNSLIIDRTWPNTYTSAYDVPTQSGGAFEDHHEPTLRGVNEASVEAPLVGATLVRLNRSTEELVSDSWNEIVTNRLEADACERLRLIIPNIVDIAAGRHVSRAGTTPSSVLVGTTASKTRIPLGGFGEGAAQILAIAVSLAIARGRVLLLDEIDTGLYYQVLHKMWEMVIRDALKHGTQVFATTHSLDCLRGLDAACRLHPELAEHISVQKMVPGIDESIPIHAEELHDALKIGDEIR